MSLGKQILRTLLIYFIALVVLIVIVFIPPMKIPIEFEERSIGFGGQVVPVATKYKYYDLERHWETIKSYFKYIIQNKTLGETVYNTTVESELVLVIKNSIVIIIAALILSSVFGILKGFFDFRMQRKKLSIFGHWTTWLFQSIPDFFIILFIQLLLIRYLPIIKFFDREGWDAFLLPAVLVAIFPTMYIARITSAALAGQVGQLYIQVARAKGLTERKILYKHIFRNCIGSILIHLPSLMVYVLSNLLLVEYFMNYNGAMYRLWKALDYNPESIMRRIELSMILWICVFFMLLLLVIQIVSLIARRYLEPSTEVKS